MGEPQPFDLFVGIDWSGAKGARHRGIRVAICEAGSDVPQIQAPPDGKTAFSRTDIYALLLSLSQDRRVLAGIDFAFAYPRDETGHYFPHLADNKQPHNAADLWALIDKVNEEAEDFYGGLIWDHADYGAYYNAPSGRKGSRFASRRRLTEQIAADVKSPSPTFNCVGPAGVGTGSLAGMRLCHALAGKAQFWPFDHAKAGHSHLPLMLVEIFPSYYFKLAGINPIKGAQAKHQALNHALAFYNSQPVPADFIADGPDHDEADALISSAALRYFAHMPAQWHVPDKARYEGWIFGLKSDKTAS